ncbi:MAG TPA: putative Ig domain-containing protein, partial [Geobacteraceae bacterium]
MQFPGTDYPAAASVPRRFSAAGKGAGVIMVALAFCFALVGEAAALVIDTAPPLPSATTTFPYTQTLSASGGVPPYAWSVVGGSLPPGLTLLQTTQTTADITGTPTAAGNYTFTVQVTDSNVVAAPATATMSYGISVVPYGPTAGIRYDISGSVSYSGTKTGRIYLTTYPSDNGISLTTPGPFTIRGVPASATMLTAWVDTQGTGNRHASDPFGTTTLTLPDSLSGITVAISDPTPQPPSPPQNATFSPGDSAVFAQWDKGLKASGIEYADTYSVYWSTSQAVSPTTTTGGGKRQNIPADDSNNVAITGLANGTPLYFVMTATVGGVESAPSPPFGPVTPGSLAGGATVSGTVTLSGVAPTGPLYVAVVDAANKGSKAFFTSVGTPGASAPFTVNGVPDGSYRVFAAIDMNNDGIMGNLGDVTLSDQ